VKREKVNGWVGEHAKAGCLACVGGGLCVCKKGSCLGEVWGIEEGYGFTGLFNRTRRHVDIFVHLEGYGFRIAVRRHWGVRRGAGQDREKIRPLLIPV